MANLKFSDKHNMVAFLKKPNESVGFTEVVDFLKGTSLRYALTHNPTIYDSLVIQFWQTATVRTLANETQQLIASIDSTEYTITEASVKSKLQLADATGIHNLSDAKIYAGLATLGPKSGGWDQFGSTIATALICLSSNRKIKEGVAMDPGEGSAQPAKPYHTPVDPLPSTSLPPIQSPPHSPHQSPPHSPHQSPPHSPYQSPPHLPHQSPPHLPHQSPPRSYEAPLPEDATGIHNLSDAEIYAGLATLGYVTEGDFVPLLPAMLAGAAVDQGEGSTQPAEPHHTPVDPISSTSQPPIPSPIPSPPHPSPPLPSPPHPSPPPHSPPYSPPHSPHQSPPFSPPHYSPPRVTSLEKELKETKQTLGNDVLTLVKKVKTPDVALKRKSKKEIVSESEGEEPEDQGRIIQDIDDDPLVSLVRESMKEKSTDFVTPIKALGEAQEEEEISPTTLKAAKTLSKVDSQSVSKAKSTDKGKRYRRRARFEINSGIEDVNIGSSKVDTGRTSISTSSIIHSPKNGQREGKAQMVEEDIQATHKTKEQIRQEEAGLEEAIRLQAQMDEEVEVQKDAQFYTEEDWDTIREKLEANTEVVKSLQGESISNDDFAKRMVEMINEKKKFYAEQKAKAKRSKPMTQAQQREYMSTFIKNQSSWKLSQLKKLSFEELKTEFEKLMKSIESFVPMETEARVKRHGLQLEQETSKKQKIDIEDASITKGKDEVVKEEEAEVPVKKTGMRRKQKARKGINIDKTAQDEFNKEREAYVKDKVKDASSESEIGVDVIPTATKPPTIVNWKIISQSSQKAAYQIIRKDGSDKIYMSFGAILKDFSRDELVKLYRLVIKKYGANRPEDMYDRVLWGDLKTMFDPPLSDDAIWNRKYLLSKDACQVMLKMKLLDGIMDEVCYQLLKMIKKQAGIRK
ncbi:hypothetical protein Tco_0410014 [Tanacetum coccineum]